MMIAGKLTTNQLSNFSIIFLFNYSFNWQKYSICAQNNPVIGPLFCEVLPISNARS